MSRIAKKKTNSSKKQKPAQTGGKSPAKVAGQSPVTSDPVIVSSMQLPGFMRLTVETFALLKQHKSLFFRLVGVFWIVSLLTTGINQQLQYQEVRDVAEVYSSELVSDGLQKPFEVFALLIAILGGAQNTTLSEIQITFTIATYLFAWLVAIWLLRHLLAGTSVKLRDGLYNAGAPVLSTLTIGVVVLLQLVPLAVIMALFSLMSVNGTLNGVLLVPIAIILLIASIVISLYWLVGTFFAAVIVTIQGTYPVAALRSSKRLMKGLRLRILLRLVWLAIVCALTFVVSITPFIIFDHLLGLTESLLVIAAIQFASFAVFTYAVAYIYLLYRKIVDGRG